MINQLESVQFERSELMQLVSKTIGGESVRPKGKWPDRWIDRAHEEDETNKANGGECKGEETLNKELLTLYMHGNDIKSWDDPNNKDLNPEKVSKARMEEMGYVKRRNVYDYVKREEVEERGGTVINVRWVDTNKGDSVNETYRSRFGGNGVQKYSR